MMLPRYVAFSFLFFFSPISQSINLQLPALHEIKLPTPPTLSHKTLGTALAISNSTIAAAARTDDNNSTGSVYIFDALDNWKLTAELTTTEANDNFAKRVILKNNRLIISADRDDSHGIDSGVVYIFERYSPTSQWEQTAKLFAPDGKENDHFGEGIFLNNNTLYIGAPLHDKGKVYVYNLNTTTNQWNFEKSIEPSDPTALHFGFAIAQDQDTLIIGAPATDDKSESNAKPKFITEREDNPDLDGFESGVIFVYERVAKEWQSTARLSPSNRWSYDHFGSNIAIEGKTIAASISHKFVLDELEAGSVYIFEKQKATWKETTILTATHPQPYGSFGSSFSILNGHLLIGANNTFTQGFNSGKVFLFNQDEKKSWNTIHQYANASVQANDQFGISVALESESMLVSSKKGVYSFQNIPMQQNTAIFYSENNRLQLEEVNVTGVGVYKVTFILTVENGINLLTLTHTTARKDLQESNITYSNSSGMLVIPRLALQQKTGETAYYMITLLLVDNEKMQFKIQSINKLPETKN